MANKTTGTYGSNHHNNQHRRQKHPGMTTLQHDFQHPIQEAESPTSHVEPMQGPSGFSYQTSGTSSISDDDWALLIETLVLSQGYSSQTITSRQVKLQKYRLSTQIFLLRKDFHEAPQGAISNCRHMIQLTRCYLRYCALALQIRCLIFREEWRATNQAKAYAKNHITADR